MITEPQISRFSQNWPMDATGSLDHAWRGASARERGARATFARWSNNFDGNSGQSHTLRFRSPDRDRSTQRAAPDQPACSTAEGVEWYRAALVEDRSSGATLDRTRLVARSCRPRRSCGAPTCWSRMAPPRAAIPRASRRTFRPHSLLLL